MSDRKCTYCGAMTVEVSTDGITEEHCPGCGRGPEDDKEEAVLQRVTHEENALSHKIYHLERFIHSERFREVSDRHQDLLFNQVGAMKLYRWILIERINLFRKEAIDREAAQ